MNILLLESPRFFKAFKALGCNVLYVGPHAATPMGQDPAHCVQLTRLCHHRELMALLDARGFRPDLVLWCDHGYLPSVFGFEALDCPVVGLTIDDYCNPWHIPFSMAFDLVLVAQKEYVPVFDEAGPPRPAREARWSPLFCDETVDVDAGVERDIPVSFVGTLQPTNIPQRLPFLQRFKESAPLVLLQGRYAPVFSRSQIVLNQTAAGELNFRIFEAAACGAAVLTEMSTNGLEELFTPGETILPPYSRGDAAAAAAMANFWLARPEATRRVAAQGQALVLARHTLQARARMLLEETSRLQAQGGQAWRLAKQGHVRRALATACGFIAAELLHPDFQKMRQTYVNLATSYPAMWGKL